MTISKPVVGLSLLIALLSLAAAGVGLFWQNGGELYTALTIRGQNVEMFGQGLYRTDTLFAGAGARGQDTVMLLFGIPLLLLSLRWYQRGSLRGALLLLGTLGYFLYTYASTSLGAVAFNELFFLYIALFAASFYAFILLITGIDPTSLGEHFSSRMPRRGPAIFLLASGIVTLVVWAGPVLAAQLAGQIPERLDSYTTLLTVALDLAIITPACFLAGALILQRRPAGYILACSLLVLEVLLLPLIAAQTIYQLTAGVTFPVGQIVGPIMGFVVLASLALWVLVSLLRNIEESPWQPHSPASIGVKVAPSSG